MQIINPATEELIREIREDDRSTLAVKFNLLKNNQRNWSATTIRHRIGILQKFSTGMGSAIELLSSVLTAETGKPLQQSRNEINGARARIKWLTENAEKYLGEEQMTMQSGLEEKISYDPLGVICNISAWNYPWLVGVNVFVSALLAGNSVMYKPSEYASLTGIEIEKLLKESGVPDHVFQLALGGKQTGEALLELPFDGYYFTGSYRTGKYIYENCASKMVPCQLEMGGKDPLYVADDIKNINQAAEATADGAFYNNGQSCCSVERIYVHEKIYEEFLDSFRKVVESWKTGAPTEAGVYFGPLTRKQQLDVLEKQVEDAIQKGAQLILGGKRAGGKGYYFNPTILINTTHDMLVMREESFGPVIGIMSVKNDDEAVRMMSDTEYGLTAAVYTESRARAEKILAQLNTGSGYWNCCDRVSAALPWSGRNHSGFGTTLSRAGMQSFVRPKAWHLRNQI
jgi:acyl-CoA reductase-like NAD-dependent aldehyde dehydrogenase